MDECTMAGCNAAGMCDQGHIINPDCKPPICHHPCPSNIKFDRRGSLDAFHLRIGFDLNFAPLDPTANGLKVTVSNANGGDLVGYSLTRRYHQDRPFVAVPRPDLLSVTASVPCRRVCGDGLWRLRVDAFGRLLGGYSCPT
jgi:hypothetical protein